jgi:hypothetical protein
MSPAQEALASRVDLWQTTAAIVAVQAADGHIPWVPGGKADPWNMIEAAMALDSVGRHDEARRAFSWLTERQLAHGGWYSYYVGDEVVDNTLDTNITAYIAVGLWHHALVTDDTAFLRDMWPVVDAAIGHVVSQQYPWGGIAWRADDPSDGALLTGSSSIHLSLRCALAIADRLGHARPEWTVALALLADAIGRRPHLFLDKSRWAMDWYYPVLSGVISGDEAWARIDAQWDDFVVEGFGVRCVSDRPWITAAETCELVIALASIGDPGRAEQLFAWMQFLRHDDGSYWCGMNFEGERFDEPGEYFTADQPTWNSAAVVLAGSMLAGRPALDAVFGPKVRTPETG